MNLTESIGLGYGGLGANLVATTAGAVIPICSCGIVPVLAGMVKAGIPLGPTMAFLIAAPMLNVPAVFITAGVLGWKLAVGRILGTFFIALLVGEGLTRWQRRQRFLRRFVKLSITPNLSPELQKFAFKVAMALSKNPRGLPTEKLALEKKTSFFSSEKQASWTAIKTAFGSFQLSVKSQPAPRLPALSNPQVTRDSPFSWD